MAALGLDSKLDRAPELPDVPWPSSAAYAGAQVLAAGRQLKPNTTKASTIFQGLPSNRKTPAKQRAQKTGKRRKMATNKANISFKIF